MKDIYPNWPKKIRVLGIEDALIRIRMKYPNAYMEGSAGLARSYFDRETRLLVGYCWSSGVRVKDDVEIWWLKIPDTPQEW